MAAGVAAVQMDVADHSRQPLAGFGRRPQLSWQSGRPRLYGHSGLVGNGRLDCRDRVSSYIWARHLSIRHLGLVTTCLTWSQIMFVLHSFRASHSPDSRFPLLPRLYGHLFSHVKSAGGFPGTSEKRARHCTFQSICNSYVECALQTFPIR